MSEERSSASPASIPTNDDQYWSFRKRECLKSDLGHICRQCKKPISVLGELIAERRGARIQMRYHAECFSDNADPRTQQSSQDSKWYSRLKTSEAPKAKYSKMRTKSHWAK